MKERSRFNVLFYIKRTKTNSQGEAPIYLRITMNGERSEISIMRSIDPSKWNSGAGKVKGMGEHAQSINKLIDTLRANIYNILNDWFLKVD